MAEKILTISHTIANAWYRGYRDDALAMIQGKPTTPPNESMLTGIKLHKEYENESLQTFRVPERFNFDPGLVQVEVKKVVQLDDWLRFSGRADAVGKDFVIDYKTGSGRANIGGHQLPLYCVLFQKSKGYICHENTQTGKVTIASKIMTPDILRESVDWLVTVACDIRGVCEAIGQQWWTKPKKSN